MKPHQLLKITYYRISISNSSPTSVPNNPCKTPALISKASANCPAIKATISSIFKETYYKHNIKSNSRLKGHRLKSPLCGFRKFERLGYRERNWELENVPEQGIEDVRKPLTLQSMRVLVGRDDRRKGIFDRKCRGCLRRFDGGVPPCRFSIGFLLLMLFGNEIVCRECPA
jgi:hypothetical protein